MSLHHSLTLISLAILLLADCKQGGAADMKASPLAAVAPLREGREGKETPRAPQPSHLPPLPTPCLLLVRPTSN